VISIGKASCFGFAIVTVVVELNVLPEIFVVVILNPAAVCKRNGPAKLLLNQELPLEICTEGTKEALKRKDKSSF
jgi:hypothetical protein